MHSRLKICFCLILGVVFAWGIQDTRFAKNKALVTFNVFVYGQVVNFERCPHETIIDAIADKLIYEFHQAEVDSNSMQNLLSVQNKIYDDVLRIKRAVCEQTADIAKLLECQSEEISEFHDPSTPYTTMWDRNANKLLKIIHRGAYSVNSVIDCHCRLYDCNFEDTLTALRRNSEQEKFRNNEATFFNVVKKLCDYSPRHILAVGADIWGYAVSMSETFPEADVFLIEGNQDNEYLLLRGTSRMGHGVEDLREDGEDGVVGEGWQRFRYEIASVTVDTNDVAPSGRNYYEATDPNLFKKSIPYFKQVEKRNVEMTTVDAVMKKHGISTIDFVMIDMHGAELSVLEGSLSTLTGVDVVQLELYFSFSDASNGDALPSFFELHAHMDALGFAMKDQGRVLRDREGELVSMTVFFVRKTSDLWGEECSLFPSRWGAATPLL